ncbi:MAG TPA: DUF4349 domain-containing protein [Chitinophagales bacterium]|nr:DUF4349 domain-containing protein [Chitinophagales bacterium]
MKNYSIKTAIYSLFILILFSQCSQRSESASEVATEAVSMDMVAATKEEAAPPTNQPNPVPSKTTDTTIQRMLTKEGTLRWETGDVEKTHAAILAQAKTHNAYVSNDNQTRDDYQTTTRMELRIPSDKFDEFISGIEKDVTKFDEKRIEVLDVTEEYIDISARMKTKKELEQHYYDLLKQTKNVAEVLLVEEQLNTVRADIESAEGRLKYLKDKVNMSTLHLTFYETTSAPVGFFGEIGKSFVSGWKGFLYFILGIISAWPIVLVVSGFLFWLIRRRRNKK